MGPPDGEFGGRAHPRVRGIHYQAGRVSRKARVSSSSLPPPPLSRSLWLASFVCWFVGLLKLELTRPPGHPPQFHFDSRARTWSQTTRLAKALQLGDGIGGIRQDYGAERWEMHCVVFLLCFPVKLLVFLIICISSFYFFKFLFPFLARMTDGSIRCLERHRKHLQGPRQQLQRGLFAQDHLLQEPCVRILLALACFHTVTVALLLIETGGLVAQGVRDIQLFPQGASSEGVAGGSLSRRRCHHDENCRRLHGRTGRKSQARDER